MRCVLHRFTAHEQAAKRIEKLRNQLRVRELQRTCSERIIKRLGLAPCGANLNLGERRGDFGNGTVGIQHHLRGQAPAFAEG